MTARKRAPKGTGSIKQRTNGRWAWQIEFKDPITDEPVRIYRERAIRADAIRAGRTAMRKHFPGRSAEEVAGGTIAEWYSEWLARVKARPQGSPATYENYEGQVRRQIIPALGHFEMSELSAADVAAFLNSIDSASTRAAVHKTLARGWQEAYNDGRVKDEFLVKRAALKAPPAQPGPIVRATTPEEATARLAAQWRTWALSQASEGSNPEPT